MKGSEQEKVAEAPEGGVRAVGRAGEPRTDCITQVRDMIGGFTGWDQTDIQGNNALICLFPFFLSFSLFSWE